MVDDDRDFAESLAEVLEAEGHTVEVGFSGEEAVQKLTEQDFDATFMDHRLPGMNGVESFVAIRQLKPDTQVIMMTAFRVEHVLQRAVDEGAIGVLQKPIDWDKAFSLLRRTARIILLVDDDPDFADSTIELLEEQGHVVQVARTGREAIEKMQEKKVRYLILDLRLPGLSGLEVYIELKKQGRVVPTIIATAYAEEEADALDQLNALEVDSVLRKPFSREQLLEVIDDLRANNS